MPEPTPENKRDILDFLSQGETYTLPGGTTKLHLTLPTVADLVHFQTLAKEAGDGADADPESRTRLPLFLLKSVTKGYDFDDDQCLQLFSKTGGLTGGLAKKVYSLFGMDLDRGAVDPENDPDLDEATPTASP